MIESRREQQQDSWRGRARGREGALEQEVARAGGKMARKGRGGGGARYAGEVELQRYRKSSVS